MSSKPNIPIKSSGDTFSAQELNTIVDFFENKPDADELIPGPEGPEGPKGDDGQSAYDIAVDNGFVGTEQEWLESLSPVRYMDADIFDGNGETPETKTTIKDGSIGEEKLSPEVKGKLSAGSVTDISHLGDGTTDVTSEIQAALDQGGIIDLGKDKSFMVSDTLHIKESNTKLIASNSKLVAHSSLGSKLLITTNNSNVEHQNTSTSIEIKKGSSMFVYDGADNLEVGQTVLIQGGVRVEATAEVGDGNYMFGHYARIKSIDGIVVTLTVAANQSFSATKIYSYNALENIIFDGVDIESLASPGSNLIRLNHVIRSHVFGGKLNGNNGHLSIFIQGLNCSVQNTEISGFENEGWGLGYGVQVSGHNVLVSFNEIHDCKHCVAAGMRDFLSTGITYRKNNVSGLMPLDFHGNTRGEIYDNDVFSTYGYAINVRDGFIDVKENRVNVNSDSSGTIKGIVFQEAFDGNCEVTGNIINIVAPNATGQHHQPIAFESKVKASSIRIVGNYSNQGLINFTGSEGYGKGLLIAYNDIGSEEEGVGAFGGIQFQSSVEEYIIEQNWIDNKWDTAYCFGILTHNSISKRGVIRENSFTMINPLWKGLIRINGSNVEVHDNSFYSDTNYNYISDQSTGKQNLIYRNKRIDSSGNIHPYGYSELPMASKLFLNRTILLGSDLVPHKVFKQGSSYVWGSENPQLIEP